MSQMKTPEKTAILVLSIVLVFLFINATRINSVSQQLDQAYFLESIDTTLATGRSTTMLGRSIIHAVSELITAPVSKICEYPLENDRQGYLSLYQRHALPILYGLAALRTFLPTNVVYYLCALVAFPGLLFIVYFRSRHLGVPVIISVVLLLMVAFHPAWSYSSFGQFYADKLFPPFCILYFFILHDWLTQDRRRPIALLVLGVLAAATSERSVIMLVAGTLGVYAFFGFRRKWSRLDFLPLILILILAVYVVIYMRFIQANSDYSSFSSGVLNFFSALHRNTDDAKAIYKFLFINLLFLVPFGFFAKRWALIALLSMIPNVIGSIGGAEKLGWSTHYHSPYFPFLIIALVMGASALWKTRSRVLIPIFMTLAFSITVLYAFMDPFSPSVSFPSQQVRQTGLVKMVEFYTGTGPAETIIKRTRRLKGIAAHIPPGSDVSTLEGYMPALYEQGVKWIHFYPLGLGKSDYLILPYTPIGDERRWEGFVSYLGRDVIEQANSCLQQKINEHYILVKEFPESRTAILQRRQ